MTPLLDVTGLAVRFTAAGGQSVDAVNGIAFQVRTAETLALLGESGSGKSVTALAVSRLLPGAARASGAVSFKGENLLALSRRRMQDFRGRRIAMIFQEPQTSLHPSLSVGLQVSETLARHQGGGRRALREKTVELLEAVGIPDPQTRLCEFPHQFSGGMKQRVMLAMALAGNPDLLIADEPTTALDVTTQARILELLKKIQRDTGMAMLFITHDLAVASQVADRIAVMRQGKIVESAPARRFFCGPEHPYSQKLLNSLPSIAENCAAPAPREAPPPLLQVRGMKVHFPRRRKMLGRPPPPLRAVDDVSLEIGAGRTLAVVGESGSGKTTLGRGILQLPPPTAGSVRLAGENLAALSPAHLRRRRGAVQIVFQDPYLSMNPQLLVKDVIEEGMRFLGTEKNAAARQERVDELLRRVGLDPAHKHRYPHEFSGGQRQRICIARALSVKPRLLVCDEPTSALDVTVQARILALLAELQEELGLAYLFITHNISVVAGFAHDVAVMYRGRIVEQGPVRAVLDAPRHEYTRRLLAAVPTIKAAA